MRKKVRMTCHYPLRCFEIKKTSSQRAIVSLLWTVSTPYQMQNCLSDTLKKMQVSQKKCVLQFPDKILHVITSCCWVQGEEGPPCCDWCHSNSPTAHSLQTALSGIQRHLNVPKKLTSVTLTCRTINTHGTLVLKIKIHKSNAVSMK